MKRLDLNSSEKQAKQMLAAARLEAPPQSSVLVEHRQRNTDF